LLIKVSRSNSLGLIYLARGGLGEERRGGAFIATLSFYRQTPVARVLITWRPSMILPVEELLAVQVFLKVGPLQLLTELAPIITGQQIQIVQTDGISAHGCMSGNG
jgi:hypothetical protein